MPHSVDMDDWEPVPLVEGSEEHASSNSLIHLSEHFAGINITKISSSSNNTSELLRDRFSSESTSPLPEHRGRNGDNVLQAFSATGACSKPTYLASSNSKTVIKASKSSYHSSRDSGSPPTSHLISTTDSSSHNRTVVEHDKMHSGTLTGNISCSSTSSTSTSTFLTPRATATMLPGLNEESICNPSDLSIGDLSDTLLRTLPEDSLNSVSEQPALIDYQSEALLQQARERVLQDSKKIAVSMGFKTHETGKRFSTKTSSNRPGLSISKDTHSTKTSTHRVEHKMHLDHKINERLFPLKEEDCDVTLVSYSEPSTDSYTTASLACDSNAETTGSTQDMIEKLAAEAFKRDSAAPTQVVPGSNLDRLDQLWQAFLRSPYAKPLSPHKQKSGRKCAEDRFNADASVLHQLQHLSLQDNLDCTDVRCSCNCQQNEMEQQNSERVSVRRNAKSTGALRPKPHRLPSSSSDSSPVLRDSQPKVREDVNGREKRWKSERPSRHVDGFQSRNMRSKSIQTSPLLMKAGTLNPKVKLLQPSTEHMIEARTSLKPPAFFIPSSPPCEERSTSATSTASSVSDPPLPRPSPTTATSEEAVHTLQEACMAHKQKFIRNCQYRQTILKEFSRKQKKDKVNVAHPSPTKHLTFTVTVPTCPAHGNNIPRLSSKPSHFNPPKSVGSVEKRIKESFLRLHSKRYVR